MGFRRFWRWPWVGLVMGGGADTRLCRLSAQIPLVALANSATACLAWSNYSSAVIGSPLPDSVFLSASMWFYLICGLPMSWREQACAVRVSPLRWTNRHVLPFFWLAYVIMFIGLGWL